MGVRYKGKYDVNFGTQLSVRLIEGIHLIRVRLTEASLYSIFDRKGPSFVYILLTCGTPSTYLVKNFASLFITPPPPKKKNKSK